MTAAVTAFAPASIGNVAVGFDVLGQAIAGVGDRCTARLTSAKGVTIKAVQGLPCAVPVTAEKNTAGAAAISLLEAADADFGAELIIHKGIPLGSGMGGSAASAVAAVVAVNALLDEPLSQECLLAYALAGEALASGAVPHADNVAPSLLGGLTLVQGWSDQHVVSLPVPSGLRSVLVHPALVLPTSAAREGLHATVPMSEAVEQLGALAGFVAGCYRDDPALIRRSLIDVIVEPQRAHMVPGFRDVQKAALDAGALGCSLSGSGPSMFAWTADADGDHVAAAMQAAFAAHGLASDCWLSPLDAPGAHVER
ncbi:MAG: homoserine kinase [Gammaproteobacteria bacterium]|nr:homoserine kinase [Gammaproteobacteria bacterium]